MLNPGKGKISKGVNISSAYSTSKEELAKIKLAGFDFVRVTTNWHTTEHGKRGDYYYNLPTMNLDKFFQDCEDVGLKVLVIFNSSNALYFSDLQRRGGAQPLSFGPNSDELIRGFISWVLNFVSRYQGKGIVWELWNEPNLYPFWRPTPNIQDYVRFALAVSRKFKETFPSELLIGPGVSKIPMDWIDACFKAGLLEYWDAVSIHPYRDGERLEPETMLAEIRTLRTLISRRKPRGKTIPVVISEMGYSELFLNPEVPVRANSNLVTQDLNLWKGVWIKPQLSKVKGPFGNDDGWRLGSADRQDSPGEWWSGVFVEGNVQVGKVYTLSFWGRTVSGNLDVFFGMSESRDQYKIVTLTPEWNLYTFTLKCNRNFLNRLISIWEKTRDNTAWEIAMPQVDLREDISDQKYQELVRIRQKDLMDKTLAFCLKNRIPLYAHYCWKDTGNDPKNFDHQYGLLDFSGNQKTPILPEDTVSI